MANSQGSVVLVTGGASGIGLATAQACIQNGARVAIFDLPPSQGETVAKELGEMCINIAGDVTKPEDVEACMERIQSTFGRLDVTVNCAGISPRQPIADDSLSVEEIVSFYENVNKINVSGTYRVLCHAIKLMKNNQPDEDGGRGVIINMSSVQAEEGIPGNTGYSGTKGAIDSMTLGLARELAQYGIRVVSVAPGLIDTPLARRPCPDWEEGYPSAMTCITFPKRAGKPEEVAKLVQHVIDNKYINATVIRIDAGFRYSAAGVFT